MGILQQCLAHPRPWRFVASCFEDQKHWLFLHWIVGFFITDISYCTKNIYTREDTICNGHPNGIPIWFSFSFWSRQAKSFSNNKHPLGLTFSVTLWYNVTFSKLSIHVEEFFLGVSLKTSKNSKWKGITKFEKYLTIEKIYVSTSGNSRNFLWVCSGLFWKESVDENYWYCSSTPTFGVQVTLSLFIFINS